MDRAQWHHLTDMLVLAVICGADGYQAIALFGQLDAAGLLTVPELSHGIPSHNTNTLERICARWDAARMEEGFRDWVQDTLAPTASQVLVIASGTL